MISSRKTEKFLVICIIFVCLVFSLSIAQSKMATSLIGFGPFLTGGVGYANPTSFKTVSLGGFQPQHPSCNQYNADGTMMTTHDGPTYRTSDGSQVCTLAPNSATHVRQWSNVDPNVIYYTTGNNCTKNTINGGNVSSTELFNLSSASSFFGVNFNNFFGGALEGSFIVGEDNAICIFGISGKTAHTLIWKIGTGWLKDHVTIPWDSWDLYCAAPIKDPKVAGNLGYVFVKAIPQATNLSASWVIVNVTSTGATSKINAEQAVCNHASMCVWQDTDGSFNPGLIDIYGTVFQPNGKSFSIKSSWTGEMHVGWIRGTIFALGENISNGSNAMALRKTNQGGYQVTANGSSTGNTSYTGCYSKDGIVNVNYKDPNGSVQMRIVKNGGIYFTAPAFASAVTGENFGLKLTYGEPKGLAGTITITKKPSWITFSGDSIYGKAPTTELVDSVVAVVKSASDVDTLKLGIYIANYYAVEAEQMTLTAPMIAVSDANSLGGKYITTTVGTTNTIAPKVEATYSIDIKSAGSYFVWLRLCAPTASANGMFIGFGTKFLTTFLKPMDTAKYEWVRTTVSVSLTAGKNSVILGHGNAQERIDKVIVTKSTGVTLPDFFNTTTAITKEPTNLQMSNLSSMQNSVTYQKGFFNVNLNQNSNMILKVFDASGRKMWEYNKANAKAGNLQIPFNYAKTNSVMFAQLQAGNKLNVARIISVR